MSKHSRRSSPRRRANQLSSETRRLPDRSRRDGSAHEQHRRPTTTPPFESIINTEPPKPSAASHFCSSSRYGPITGIVAALHAVVIIRGYSRICGEISAEMHTGTPSSRRRCSAISRSLAGLAYALMRQTPTDSTFASRRADVISSRSAADGDSMTSPEGLVRSAISTTRSRGTGGLGNSICRSYMSYRCSSRISIVSPKPAVVTTPARPIFPSINALVMSVVAWTIGAVISAGCTPAFTRSWRTPARTPSSGAAGVVSVLSTITRPLAASISTTSVNVPPMSTASRQPLEVGYPFRRSSLGGANTSRIHTSSSSSSPMNTLSPCQTDFGAR